MTSWGWKRERTTCSGRLPVALRALSMVVPWLTAGLLFVMFMMIGGTFTTETGALFALPESTVTDADESAAVALLLPTAQGTLVFFDDTRYILEDDAQMESFSTQLSERLNAVENATLLALADVRIRHGIILRFAEIARRSGARRILFAEKKATGTLE